MHLLTILKNARALIADEDHWTTGILATDRNGKCVPDYSDAACKFCAIGAMRRAAFAAGVSNARSNVANSAYAALAAIRGTGFDTPGFATINDREGHAAVLHALDTVIAQLPDRPDLNTEFRVAA